MSFTMLFQLAVVLLAIAIGARAGGVGMGLWGGVGLVVQVFGGSRCRNRLDTRGWRGLPGSSSASSTVMKRF